MEAVKISPKFQVVIPKNVRESMKLIPGQRLQVIQYEDRIELIPIIKITEMKGFLKGIDTHFEREEDRV
ncbi:AbrB/MazE/SpoVT family DNA-binding domain-containing protein [bacterium]|nr:AbrB/MazE/SpoVT family DNA-binding domain-containing protein [bacterium]